MALGRVAASILGWHDDAACRGVPHWVFANDTEPLRDGRPRPPYDDAKAKSICGPCEVRAECLDDAIARSDLWLTRGGLNRDELLAERRRRYRKRPAA
ncbi:WhiB family transcriptional regulator [Nonomuraea sp. NPDC001684]